MSGADAGGSAAAMPVFGTLAAHGEKCPRAGVSDGSGQWTAFVEHGA